MDQVCETLPAPSHQKLYLQDETPIFGVQCPWLLNDYWWILDTALGHVAIQIWGWMERGWLVLGDHLQLSRKTRVEILRFASTPKYTNDKFQHFHCLFESEAINPFNTHQTMFCTIISQYNICSTISAVQYLWYNICSTNILQSTPYLGDLVLSHEE